MHTLFGCGSMEEKILCICCNRRKENLAFAIKEKYIGICTECNKKLEYLPKGTVFYGNDNLQTVFSALYYKGNIRRIIGKYKFSGQRRYSEIFSLILYDYLKDLKLHENFDLITMIPLSRKRLWERGYNQTELIAEKLSKMLGIAFDKNCIFKKVNNKRQSTKKTYIERKQNVEDVYLAYQSKIKGKSILVLDDVYTSGATMKSCAKELIEKGAENLG